MNYIFLIFIVVSLIVGILNGKIDDVIAAIFDSSRLAVNVALSLIGIMAFWLGIMRLVEKSGLANILSKIIEPFVKILFKDIKDDKKTMGNITMSLSANALGLANAATPIGLKVMEGLQDKNTDKSVATDSMCMFLGMNTAGFQIIPATVIAILVGAGAGKPSEIILPTLIVTTISFLVAIFTALVLKKIWKKSEVKDA